MVYGSCPDCGADIPVGLDPFPGQQVACMNCGVMLEVTSLQPFTLDIAEVDYLEFDEDDEDSFDDDEGDAYEELWRRARRQKARSES